MAFTGFSYRGIHTSDFPYEIIVSSIDRSYGPDMMTYTLPIPVKDGSYPVRQDDRERDIRVTFHAAADSLAGAREMAYQFSDWLRAEKDGLHRPESHPIIFDDDPERRFMGFPKLQVHVREAALQVEVVVTFVCPMPYAESAAPLLHTGPHQPVIGGTEPAHAIITCEIKELTTSLQITEAVSGRFLLLQKHIAYWNVDMDDGDIIVIDTAKRLITRNGADARAGLVYTRKWFVLPPGQVQLEFDPVSTILKSIEYRERWR